MMKHIPKEASKAASLLGKRAAGVAKTITAQERERRRTNMRKVALARWARIKAAAKLLIVAALVGLPAISAYAIPSGVLNEQAKLHKQIAAAVQACGKQQCSSGQREKIVANIKQYIALIEDNIEWCKRALKSVSVAPSRQPVTTRDEHGNIEDTYVPPPYNPEAERQVSSKR
jgi:hypothetical protein